MRGQLPLLDREDPDLGECFAIVAYGLDQGRIRGVDVSGLNLVLIAHIPGNVLAGNWEIVALVDERATPEQRDLLLGAFTGKLGGPLADLAQLIGSVKGVEFVLISHHVEGGTGTLRIPGMVERQRWTRTGVRTGASPPCRTRSSPRCRAPPPGWPRPA